LKFISSKILVSFLFLTLIVLNSCSIYKSDGRKNLESTGPTYYQNKVASTAALISSPAMNSYLNQHSEKIVYTLCELEGFENLVQKSIEPKCSLILNCIEISDLEKVELERHSSLEAIDQTLLLSQDEHRIFKAPIICVTR
jgi:hypothetical protein